MIMVMPENDHPTPCVATIGFFDGVHRGHAFLVNELLQLARERSMEAAVITFRDHPRRVLGADFQPLLLTTNDEKRRMFVSLGIDRYVELPFDRAMAAMTAHDFMRDVLATKLNVKVLLIGYDNRFGHNRDEGYDDYVGYGRELGIEVKQWQVMNVDGINVSSSVVRRLLTEGDVEKAALCLGYDYFLSGRVVHGVQIGRRIGHPTANITPIDPLKVVPADGVYAVRVLIGGKWHNGVMNIGRRPTFGGGNLSMEVNIFDFEQDIYGQEIVIRFAKRLRSERTFASAADLARQIAIDKADAARYFEN